MSSVNNNMDEDPISHEFQSTNQLIECSNGTMEWNEIEVRNIPRCSDFNITSSWVFLDSDKNATETFEGETTTQKTECEDKPSDSSEFNPNDCANKSDGESDGISVISESELFNGSSEEDDSTTSRHEETPKRLALLRSNDVEIKETSEHQEMIEFRTDKGINQTVIANPDWTEMISKKNPDVISSNSNFFLNNGQNLFEHSDILGESSDSTSKQPTIEKEGCDRDASNSKVQGVVAFFLQTSILFCIITILFAFLASRISIRSNEDNMLSPNTLTESRHNLKKEDKFENFDNCFDIIRNNEFSEDIALQRCMEKLLKGMKKSKKLEKQNSMKKSMESTYYEIYQDTDMIFSENYIKPPSNNVENEHKVSEKKFFVENIKKPSIDQNMTEHKTKNSKNIWQSKKKISTFLHAKENLEEKIRYEKNKLKNWEKYLAKKERLLTKWEVKLKKKEQKYYEGKHSPYGTSSSKKQNKHLKKGKIKSEKLFDKNKHKFQSRYDKTQNNFQNKMHPISEKETKFVRIPSIRKINQTNNFHDKKITGEWYINLSQSRNYIRKKNGKASWWFDRVNSRKIKRDKAYWYFQYMFNRESLRYNQRSV